MSSTQRLTLAPLALRPAFTRLALAVIIGAGTVVSLAATWTMFHRELVAPPLAAAAPGGRMGAAALPAAGGVRNAGARKAGQGEGSRAPISGG
jgi:hypothetical protein